MSHIASLSPAHQPTCSHNPPCAAFVTNHRNGPNSYWDFRNESAAAYWVDRVIGQLAQDSSMHGGRTAVFFDESDWGQCHYTKSTLRHPIRPSSWVVFEAPNCISSMRVCLTHVSLQICVHSRLAGIHSTEMASISSCFLSRSPVVKFFCYRFPFGDLK